ncbi:MAG: phosphoglycerate dehydrogenase [Gammaproteobacteria bacterium]|nr:MAG: phosphoglycerate dehydrogenase [Gammaproteobacteria bacterium]
MKIFVADKIADEGVEFLKNQPGLDVDFTTGLSEAEACEHIREADAVIVRSATSIRGDILEAGKNLKVIGRAGIGVDNIDIPAATERGIVVLNTPDANATTTAELAIAHMMSLSRHLPFADQSIRNGKWERSSFMGAELSGKTLGVIGFGTIGRIAANRGLGLNMNVVAYDPFVTDEIFTEACVTPMDIDQLLECADFVTLHCPLIEQTRNLISRERLAIMKPGARLINCARGGLIDEKALFDALDSGQLAGAALDVYENEPPKDSPLLKLNNIVFTPHLGASTEEAQTAVGVEIAKQIATFLSSGEAINALNMPRVATEEALTLKPYQEIASKLGQLMALMATSPIKQLEVSLHGQIASCDPHPVAVEALVGLLQNSLSIPVNQVNAVHLAKRQGIALTESRSEATHDYISMVSVKAKFDNEEIIVSGTLLNDKYARLIQINDYQIEAPLSGNLLITRHSDQPGVVGALGVLLGEEGINISNMQVGVKDGLDEAIAIIGISQLLSETALGKVADIPAIDKVIQVSL